jgi:anti-sigma regulatory factor (Ser/Thr protein kinase)
MEVTASHRRVRVTEPSQPSAARFAAQEAAEAAGLGREDVYRAGLVTTELATNLVKHTSGGEILVRRLRGSPSGEIEILAIDKGPGMADVGRSLADGHSTAGSPGMGLGAVQRLADEFDLYSQPGRGTVVLTRVRQNRIARRSSHSLQFSGISIAMAGESVCGDSWQIHYHADGALAFVADGLGHGLQAGEAATAAIEAVDPRKKADVRMFLEDMHFGLKHTRGAAAAIAEILPGRGLVRFAGVGNITAAISRAGMVRHAVSHSGTLGHQARDFREYAYPWQSDAVFVMHSDGLGTRWSLDDYPGLRTRQPAVIAAVLYRDFDRQRDDITVVVGREAA